jgi:hypothetical protein
MSHVPEDFRDRLLRCESPPGEERKKYEKEVRAMFEKRLGTAGRGAYVFWTLFSLSLAAVFAWAAVTSYGQIPIWGTVIFVAGVVFGLGFAGLAAYIAVTGRVQIKSQPPAMAGMAWGVTVLVATISLVAAPTLPDPMMGIRMVLFSTVFLVMAAVGLLGSRTEQAELRTREKLLEIEYRLAELAESLRQAEPK